MYNSYIEVIMMYAMVEFTIDVIWHMIYLYYEYFVGTPGWGESALPTHAAMPRRTGGVDWITFGASGV